MTGNPTLALLRAGDDFSARHIGPRGDQQAQMLALLGYDSLDALTHDAVPAPIQLNGALDLGPGASEDQMLRELAQIAAQNKVARSLLGMGYHDCITPPVILRNIIENPGWYTQYTPYQAEIAQGRLEALLNFQTLIVDLTGLPVANASLLDEGTAAAEAMTLCLAAGKGGARFFVSRGCHPQTIAVVQTRAEPLGIEVVVGDEDQIDLATPGLFGALLQHPATHGRVRDLAALIARIRAAGAMVVLAADLLALTLLRSPGELGADIAVGSTQRFGVPMGYGGPHAAFFATAEAHRRRIPGRLVGLTQDSAGGPALRLALQTREQHIRRERATSNICTSQVLLAIVASMYAVYHGPDGLSRIARRVRAAALTLASGLRRLGLSVNDGELFDTVCVRTGDQTQATFDRALAANLNLRRLDHDHLCVSLDERSDLAELDLLLQIFAGRDPGFRAEALTAAISTDYADDLARQTPFLTHPVFHQHRSETELLRYITKLQSRDLSLTTSMIPLGSCTMKLNAAAEMIPVTWPAFGALHPFAPLEQTRGYQQLFDQLSAMLAEVTGFEAVSLQPNAGSQGEYTGLLVIRAWHLSRGDRHRDVCLIPDSAHGTNPASAVMAGMRVIGVRCDEQGNIDLDDLRKKAAAHADKLSALMVTYPSTHGVFEETITEICALIHAHGGQVYLDGANMNAQVGLCRPGDFGADVCHLNLHKTFCIPHGGGGPGMGPIGVKGHLAPFLPGHPVIPTGGERAIGPVAAAPWGSPSILPISWAYIRMMGADGLRRATQVAILNANYIARRLEPHFPVLYKGASGLVAHECILDLRHFKRTAGVEVVDVAKRLMDYGFHAPTVSWPVAGTIMIEPTESESKPELDRFCDALIAIRAEIAAIEDGRAHREDNPLKRAPHTAAAVLSSTWDRAYTREEAATPAPWVAAQKFWPVVGRVDDAYGDRHLICTCPSVEELSSPSPSPA
jgi:glycine dehydrogenase